MTIPADGIGMHLYTMRDVLAEDYPGTLKRLAGIGYRRVYSSDRFPARASTWLQSRYSVTATDTASSVRSLLTRPPGPAEMRVLASSVFKRVR